MKLEKTSSILRVNVIGTLWGEDISIRLMPTHDHALKIDDLGFVGNQKSKALQMVSSNGGIDFGYRSNRIR